MIISQNTAVYRYRDISVGTLIVDGWAVTFGTANECRHGIWFVTQLQLPIFDQRTFLDVAHL